MYFSMSISKDVEQYIIRSKFTKHEGVTSGSVILKGDNDYTCMYIFILHMYMYMYIILYVILI